MQGFVAVVQVVDDIGLILLHKFDEASIGVIIFVGAGKYSVESKTRG